MNIQNVKLVLLGPTQVGKTCILQRVCDGQYVPDTVTTSGVDFRYSTITIKEQTVKLQLWDTAGQERFRAITGPYYRGANGVVLIYDITSKKSLQDLNYWIESVQKNAPPNVEKMIIANKADLQHKRQVDIEEGQNFADSVNAIFYEVSAKTGENLMEAFTNFTQKILFNGIRNDTKKTVPLNVKDKKKKKKEKKEKSGGCC
ncbi:ras and ef-hand domain-containing protein [Anaeramoeba ignava]|uniref:Ras and ef-hand domain-containing protein n=1 Tax=Anaeramoeba ignava TaxID=1746090 RepID=A0A9Q0LM96_ANAIG|nr:ras and ef-hand domain-containing protein [Anaeramoeba ignava]